MQEEQKKNVENSVKNKIAEFIRVSTNLIPTEIIDRASEVTDSGLRLLNILYMYLENFLNLRGGG